jgi:anti-sigma factor RsiW
LHDARQKPDGHPSVQGAPQVSDVLLERYRLGELPAAAKAALEGRLAVDEALRARLDALRLDDEGFTRAHDVDVLARA